MDKFQVNHYKPISIDSTFNQKLSRLLLNELDSRGFFLLEQDTISITQTLFCDSKGLSDQLDKSLKEIYENYVSRIRYIESHLEVYRDKGSDYLDYGKVYLPLHKKIVSTYKKDTTELLIRWKRYLAYTSYFSLFDLEDSTTVYSKESSHQKFPEYWNKNVEEEICALKEWNLSYEDFCNIWLECLAKAHDPHSSYFTYEESTNFFNQLSTENLSFGLYFTRNKNKNIEINYLTPGGAAWNSGELNEGDIILSLILGNSDTIDLKCKDPYNLIIELDDQKEKKLTLKIKKQNGEIHTVSILKSPIEVEENIIKSFIIDQNIGYIKLPGFYSGWNQDGPSGCSNDMAKEILKLQQDNIEGLIIDLRYNGGGSLTEAIDLCGIFINEGPLCITHDNKNEPKTLKDRNRGSIYDGPLVIMVNPYSASASELFAGIMQDYNRAIIVGDTTYGKGSVQITYESDDRKEGYKITVEGFYSIDLNSHQNKGVVPDIILPNYYFNKPKESKELYSLEFPEIEKKLYYTLLPELDKKELQIKSKNRLQSNIYFESKEKIQNQYDSIQKLSFQINYNDLIRLYHSFLNLESLDLELKIEDQNAIKNNSTDALLIDFDPTKKEVNKYAIEDLKKDIYLHETRNILNDLIKQLK